MTVAKRNGMAKYYKNKNVYISYQINFAFITFSLSFKVNKITRITKITILR